MARSGGMSAVVADLSDRNQAAAWFEHQPREVCIALPVRSALRVLPLIESRRDAPDFAPRVTLSVLRACFVAWAIAEYPTRHDRLRRHAFAAANATRTASAYATITAARADAAAMADAAAYTAAIAAEAQVNNAYAALDYAAAADTSAALATRADAVAIEQGRTTAEIVTAPLWSGEIPERIAEAWDRLRTWMQGEEANNWHPWVQWYERVRDGQPSLGEAFDLAVASLTDEQWNEEPRPAAVNRRIAALLAEHASPPVPGPDPIPPQGPGPHVVLNAAGKLDLAPPEDIDADGNNVGRIRQLLPVVRQAAADLAGHLNPNLYPELERIVAQYRDTLGTEGETVDWGLLFGLGVRLDNAAVVAGRDIADRLHESLEDAAQEALASLLRLHGPLILSTRDGRELSEIADDFARRPEQQADMRQDAEAIAAGFKRQPEIVEPAFKQLIEDAAETLGQGSRPERGAAYWMGLARNVATVAVPASALGTLVWLIAGIDGGIGTAGGAAIGAASGLLLQENARIREAARALGEEYSRLVDAALRTATDQADLAKAQAIARLRLLTPFRDFVIANEEPLRRIAAYSPSLRWMVWYIDFVLRTDGKR